MTRRRTPLGPHMNCKCELLRRKFVATEVRHLEVEERLAASPEVEGAQGRGSLDCCGGSREHLDLSACQEEGARCTRHDLDLRFTSGSTRPATGNAPHLQRRVRRHGEQRGSRGRLCHAQQDLRGGRRQSSACVRRGGAMAVYAALRACLRHRLEGGHHKHPETRRDLYPQSMNSERRNVRAVLLLKLKGTRHSSPRGWQLCGSRQPSMPRPVELRRQTPRRSLSHCSPPPRRAAAALPVEPSARR